MKGQYMILLNPKQLNRFYPDDKSREIMQKTVQFFENKGKKKLKSDFHERVWYDDFLGFVKKEKIFSTLLTPTPYGGSDDHRWDTWRNCEFNEILGFYGLCYWYTWQVSILGLGPIWMSKNEAAKKMAAKYLEEGEIFAFGLSEKSHGADIYSSDMMVTDLGNGNFRANGGKYYIGNANKARMISTFGILDDSNEYVFFVADSQNKNFELIKNVVNSQSYVAEFNLQDYAITDNEILGKGEEAWNSALNTINVGKYNLGWASIGICTHALYEAINHASNRILYGKYVTDFSQVRQLFIDSYTRLLSMKLFALRASDYMRSASLEDRRYLLYNPMVKMKVTMQGEDVINLLWDVIAAKGFEKDMYFEIAAIDIRALPKLEGTAHVNMALIVKFMANFLFNPKEYPEIPQCSDAANDDFLFNQGTTRGLGKIQFHDYQIAYNSFDLPNISIFKEQITALKEFLTHATPNEKQQKDIDFLLTLGEIFTLVPYGQLILENAKIYNIEESIIDQIFDFMVRDFSKYALQIYSKPSSTEKQMDYALKMIRKPKENVEQYNSIWTNHVYALKGIYEMKE